MSTTYRTVPGDTFASVARKTYGIDARSALLRSANPGVNEPLFPGTLINVPPDPAAPVSKSPSAISGDPDEVSITLDGKDFRYFSEVSITRNIDTFDTVEMTSPFEPSDPSHRETFRPFRFRPVTVFVGGELLFTGTNVGVDPVATESGRTVSLSAYSLPGVLNDCNYPVSALPAEFDNSNLREIALKLCEPFGIPVQIEGSPGERFERVACEPARNIFDFLADIGRQRNFILTNTADGFLRYWRSVKTGSPVARLVEGSSPLVSVSPSFSPQQYYSDVSALEPTSVAGDGGSYTRRNTRLRGVVRPHTFVSKDAEGGDLKSSVDAKTGRMFGTMAAYTVELSTWRDARGRLWEPNTTVTLLAPGAMVYREYEFVIRSVNLSATADRRSASLSLVFPGSFSGEIPESLPWEE